MKDTEEGYCFKKWGRGESIYYPCITYSYYLPSIYRLLVDCREKKRAKIESWGEINIVGIGRGRGTHPGD